MKKLISITIFVIIIAIGLTIFIVKHNKTAAPVNHKSATVTVTSLTPRLLPQVVDTYGHTISPKSVAVAAQDGGIITAINFQPGQRVKRGTVLFHLRATEIDMQSPSLKEKMLLAKSLYQRLAQKNKDQPGSVTEYRLLQVKSAYQEAKIAYDESQTIEQVDAPIDGVVSDTELAVGDYVAAGKELAQIVDHDSLQMRYQLPSNYAGQVHVGQKVVFYPVNSSQGYAGKVSYVAPLLDIKDDSLTLRADFAQLTHLPPNQFGRVEQVVNANYKTLAIPQKLVQADARGFYVYVVAKSKVNKIYFVAGKVTKSGLVPVISGIPANTLMITSNASALHEGQVVTTKVSQPPGNNE